MTSTRSYHHGDLRRALLAAAADAMAESGPAALSLRDLGKLAGVSYDAIHAIEVGKQEPRPSTVRKLAAALGIEPEVLFTNPDESGKTVA